MATSTASEPLVAGVARLHLALHAAIPPALFSALMNAVVTNKTYGPCKLVGQMLSPGIRTMLRRLYVAWNALFLVAVAVFLRWNCPTSATDSIERAKTQETCLPANSLVAIGLLLLLWLDRGTLAFLNAPGASDSTFWTRIARGASCGGFLMAVSEQDAIANAFLLLALANRQSGSITWAPRLRVLDRWIRVGVALCAVHAMYYETSSRRLAAACLACTIHTR
jgi:hypothetical protein